MLKRFIITIPDEQDEILKSLVSQGVSPSRNALIQQIIAAFIADLRTKRPKENPKFLESALGALAGAFLFGLGIVALKEIFGGEQ
ncbi:MAG: hypothetical protein ACXACG_14065 [Candidatus Thorarchaeota archaeon]|jgi:hypothetical protein